jgi:hypothetical protein
MSNWRNAFHNAVGVGSDSQRTSGSEDPNANYRSKAIQGFLPPSLQWFQWSGQGKNKVKSLTPFAEGLMSGSKNIGDLYANPGGLGNNLAGAIAPRVAMESEMINRNTQGQASEAAGAAARSGEGGGFAQALQASIQQAGARDKAASLRTGMMDSAQLRRADLNSMMDTYRMLLDYANSARNSLRGKQTLRLDQQAGSRAGVFGTANMIGNAVGGIGGAMGGGK